MKYPQPCVAHGCAAERSDRWQSFAFFALEILLIGMVGVVPSNSLESTRALDPIVIRAPITDDRRPVLDSVIPDDRFPVGAREWGQPWKPVDRTFRGVHQQIARDDGMAGDAG